MKIEDILNHKKILIWGYGREGRSMKSFIDRHVSAAECAVFEGRQEEIDEDAWDYIIKSPGIVPDHFGPVITSMTELFLMEFGKQTVGITGTKGKSTTASLLYDVLAHEQERKVLLMGNIGLPCLDFYDEIDEDTLIVFEMSCHQLENISCSPHVAVLLNLFPEHLDHYGTFERYAAAKKNITKWQTPEDYFYAGESLRGIETKAKITLIPEEPETVFPLQLKGKHNQYNAQIVYRICTELFHCDPEAVIRRMSRFSTLPHRMERIAEKNGVTYYDDSISTIPEAAIAAAGSIPNPGTLLIGGMDRGISYDGLIDFIREHPELNFVCMYAAGKRIYGEVSSLPYCCYCEDLEEAVRTAKKITKPGQACILSPAAASYGYFTNFEERGDAFRKLVEEES